MKCVLVQAPMPALVLEVALKVGDVVQVGQRLFLVESMKMEVPVSSTVAGTVLRVCVSEGESVNEDDTMAEIEVA